MKSLTVSLLLVLGLSFATAPASANSGKNKENAISLQGIESQSSSRGAGSAATLFKIIGYLQKAYNFYQEYVAGADPDPAFAYYQDIMNAIEAAEYAIISSIEGVAGAGLESCVSGAIIYDFEDWPYESLFWQRQIEADAKDCYQLGEAYGYQFEIGPELDEVAIAFNLLVPTLLYYRDELGKSLRIYIDNAVYLNDYIMDEVEPYCRWDQMGTYEPTYRVICTTHYGINYYSNDATPSTSSPYAQNLWKRTFKKAASTTSYYVCKTAINGLCDVRDDLNYRQSHPLCN
ncbi:MAG: hypothetical protein QNJ97_05965 [Myxococcota bacterium]|nr:hypothetical protein [Myxococcota bacterium]